MSRTVSVRDPHRLGALLAIVGLLLARGTAMVPFAYYRVLGAQFASRQIDSAAPLRGWGWGALYIFLTGAAVLTVAVLLVRESRWPKPFLGGLLVAYGVVSLLSVGVRVGQLFSNPSLSHRTFGFGFYAEVVGLAAIVVGGVIAGLRRTMEEGLGTRS